MRRGFWAILFLLTAAQSADIDIVGVYDGLKKRESTLLNYLNQDRIDYAYAEEMAIDFFGDTVKAQGRCVSLLSNAHGDEFHRLETIYRLFLTTAEEGQAIVEMVQDWERGGRYHEFWKIQVDSLIDQQKRTVDYFKRMGMW